MASTNTLLKKILNVKDTVVIGGEFYTDVDGINHVRITVRPNRWHENDCPFCHKSCPRYDRQIDHPRTWRGLDWGGTLVEVVGQTHRIQCVLYMGLLSLLYHGHIREAVLLGSLTSLLVGLLFICPEARYRSTCALTGRLLAAVYTVHLTKSSQSVPAVSTVL